MLQALSTCILKIERGIQQCARPEDRVLGKTLLSYLAPILASSELSKANLSRLQDFERLLGYSFLIEPAPFEDFSKDWLEYKEQCERYLTLGMSSNERLHALGLLEEFDSYVQTKDWVKLRTVLKRAHFDDQTVEVIVCSKQNAA